MSVAEQIFEEVQVLPEPEQKSVLEFVEKLAHQNGTAPKPAPKAGSAKGLIHIAPGFDEPLDIISGKKVRLPLIDAQEPGVLNLTNADIEELLA